MKTPVSPVHVAHDLIRTPLAKSASGLSPIALALAYADWALHLAASPTSQARLARKAMALPLQTAARILSPTVGDKATNDAQDHRFDGPAWSQWPFKALQEAFQATETWWDRAAQIPGVSAHHTHIVRFYTRQILDSVSPSNLPLANPEALKLGYTTLGQSWIRGYRNLLLDMAKQQHARGPTEPSALPPLPYAVGQDVATTPGKVIFRNPLVELIQYAPCTSTVTKEPLLIVPSCIMKYYILDLSPGNSLVRYLVAKGYTVFMLSWRNPDANDRDLSLDDYLQTGVMEAMAHVRMASGVNRIHALGYCLGGTLLSIVASQLARTKEAAPLNPRMPELASVTLLAAMTDFTETGEMGIFIDEEQVKTLQTQMAETGYLSGQKMAGTFQFLHARDLIWSRHIRRYLLGEDETGNDMMSWNSDVTRLPARMHSEYLEKLFLHNELAEGQFSFADANVALMNIQAPMLVVGTVRDHVCPWQSVYQVHRLTDTDTTFILAAGGHNAGIISEPGHPHRSYQMAQMDRGHGWTDPTQWQATAPRHEGSWWEAMHFWLQSHSSTQVAARGIPPASIVCDAPGEYVMVRYAD